mmetsp:Transcript_8605/g.26075  ORF Transcript_8605/g.26075 Transcript_8605/m.26075 type:complete len:344 (+) Transcript_8605:225-1256(+)
MSPRGARDVERRLRICAAPRDDARAARRLGGDGRAAPRDNARAARGLGGGGGRGRAARRGRAPPGRDRGGGEARRGGGRDAPGGARGGGRRARCGPRGARRGQGRVQGGAQARDGEEALPQRERDARGPRVVERQRQHAQGRARGARGRGRRRRRGRHDARAPHGRGPRQRVRRLGGRLRRLREAERRQAERGIGLVRGRRVAVGPRGARGAAGSGRRPRRHGHHERGRHGLQRGVEGFIFRRRRPSVHLARRSWRCYVLEEDAASTSDFEVGRARRSPSSRARSSCRSLWLPATCSAGRWGRRSAVGRRRRRCDRRSPVADADRRSPVADVTVVRVYILLDL